MQRVLCPGLVLALLSAPAYAAPDAEDPATPQLKTTAAQASYGIGLSIARQIKGDGLEVDLDALMLGMRDAMHGEDPRLTNEQVGAAIKMFQEEMRAKAEERRKILGEKNKKEGAEFLTANKAKDGVITLESGLQYKVLKEGDGATPELNDRISAHYHGTLIDGTVFDSSVERKEPVTFGVGGVIRGWTEALQLMQVGDKWRLFVPSELAYGPQSRGEHIGPHSVLIFDVELLSIE